MKKGINNLLINSGGLSRKFGGSAYRSILIMSSESIFIENDVPNVGIERLDILDLEDNNTMLNLYKRLTTEKLLIELSGVTEEEICNNEILLSLINCVELVIWNNIVLKDTIDI